MKHTSREQIDIFVDDLIKRPEGSFSDKDSFLKEWLSVLIADHQASLIQMFREVIGEPNEKLPSIGVQPYLWSERNARNYLKIDQLKRLEERVQEYEKEETTNR